MECMMLGLNGRPNILPQSIVMFIDKIAVS